MKVNSAALFLAVRAASLLSSARAVCEDKCTGSGEVPGADFTISYSGRCTPEEFTKVANVGTQACLVCLYNHDKGASLTSINDTVKELCIEGYAANVFPYAEISLPEGEEKSLGRSLIGIAQFDNEHYSGGGEWNYKVQTASGENVLEEDAARVSDVYHYEAQRKVIEFPESTIESFNPYTKKTIIETIRDLDGCDLNAAYCCFAQDRQAKDNNGNCDTPYEYNCVDKDPTDNANICYVDHTRSSNKAGLVSKGFSIYGDLDNKENIEGSVHCRGFAWSDDPLSSDHVLRGNLLFYASMYDALTQRGYARNVPGSPMCACAENMAVVTRADCTQTSTSEKSYFKWTAATKTLAAEIDIRNVIYHACQGDGENNDLEARVKKLWEERKVTEAAFKGVQQQLVGNAKGKCNAAIEAFLGEKNIITKTRAAAGDKPPVRATE